MIRNSEPLHIIGLGARSAIGLSAPGTAAAVRAGLNRFGEHPFMIDKAGEAMIVSRAKYLSIDICGVERFVELALPAAGEAMSPVTKLPGHSTPIPFILGLPAPRPGLPEGFAEEFAQRLHDILKSTYPFSNLLTISCGHSAGLMAIEAGWQKMQENGFDFCLAGGVDSYLEPETLEWLDWGEQLHSETNKWGFTPGEAAGFCLLASRKAVQAYRLPVCGTILSAATARESNLIKTESVCIGEGLSKAFRAAMQILAGNGRKIDQTICDMNGERYRADEFAFTILRTAERFTEPGDFLAPADCWGDVGAASGPLFVNLALQAASRGYAKGPLTLVWSSSEDGERSAALIYSQLSNSRKN